ncbi:MAG: hypothetical protein WEB90_04460 [Gemmatimonadota bacterium]
MLCPPTGYEAIQCYYTLRLLAQQLADAGFHALRIDYHGTGESLGSDEDPGRVAAWFDSITTAVDVLAALDEVEAVGLIGIRLGATLAARVASENDLVRQVVLWEPCASGSAYTRELEILASATTSLLGAESVRTPDGDPGGIVAAGYQLTAETIGGLDTLRLDRFALKPHTAVLVVERDDRPGNLRLAEHLSGLGCETTVERLAGYKELMVEPARSRAPQATLDRIRTWALERSHAASGAASRPLLAPEAKSGSLRHRPVRFGPAGRLFGVVTEPSSPDALQPAVVFLAGGVVPRTAVNRLYVSAARRLAALGHTVLRLDISGIGESPPADGAGPNDAYAASLVPDVVTAIGWLGERDVWLVGLCSGAYAAFQAASTESRVTGAVLINPIVFHGAQGMSRDSTQVQQVQASRQYSRSLTDAAKWRKLLSGQVDVRFALGVLWARARTWAASRSGRGLPADLRQLLGRGVRVGIAFSEGDPGVDAFTSQVGARLPELEKRGLVIRHFAGADHTFNPLAARGMLLDWVVGHISDARHSQ